MARTRVNADRPPSGQPLQTPEEPAICSDYDRSSAYFTGAWNAMSRPMFAT